MAVRITWKGGGPAWVSGWCLVGGGVCLWGRWRYGFGAPGGRCPTGGFQGGCAAWCRGVSVEIVTQGGWAEAGLVAWGGGDDEMRVPCPAVFSGGVWSDASATGGSCGGEGGGAAGSGACA